MQVGYYTRRCFCRVLGGRYKEKREVGCIPVGVGEWRLIRGYLSNQQTNPVQRVNRSILVDEVGRWINALSRLSEPPQYILPSLSGVCFSQTWGRAEYSHPWSVLGGAERGIVCYLSRQVVALSRITRTSEEGNDGAGFLLSEDCYTYGGRGRPQGAFGRTYYSYLMSVFWHNKDSLP
jgi:hypothetical protein